MSHSPGPSLDQTTGRSIASAVRATRIGGLDFLRALAVTMVIVGHAIEGQIQGAEDLGGLGVKVFFVLSGFLITRLLLDEYASHGGIDFFGFYRRRVARLMPVFYLYLAFAVALTLHGGREVPWGAVASSIFYVTNYYQAFTGAATNIVSHCWSLAVEEQFYLLWPMLIVAFLRRGTSLAKALVTIVVGVWCWRWFLLASEWASVDYLYRALDTRADDLAIGCLAAVLVRSSRWRERLAVLIRTPGVAWLLLTGLAALVTYGTATPVMKYGLAFVIEPPIVALLMLMTVLVSRQRGWMATVVNHSLLVHIGQISYCMYLFHGLIGFTIRRLTLEQTGILPLALVVEYAAIVAFASVSFRFFENPLRRWIASGSHVSAQVPAERATPA
jgi:peptidoglycan/LPS O-acetylase OafA/YrhL